jgi:hypothetical protein
MESYLKKLTNDKLIQNVEERNRLMMTGFGNLGMNMIFESQTENHLDPSYFTDEVYLFQFTAL